MAPQHRLAVERSGQRPSVVGNGTSKIVEGGLDQTTPAKRVSPILILSSTAVRAELLRRGTDGSWPASSTVIEDGDLMLESIDLTVPLAAINRTTRLARG